MLDRVNQKNGGATPPVSSGAIGAEGRKRRRRSKIFVSVALPRVPGPVTNETSGQFGRWLRRSLRFVCCWSRHANRTPSATTHPGLSPGGLCAHQARHASVTWRATPMSLRFGGKEAIYPRCADRTISNGIVATPDDCINCHGGEFLRLFEPEEPVRLGCY